MKNVLAFVVLLFLFVLLAYSSHSWYKEHIGCCGRDEAAPAAVEYPLIFDCAGRGLTTSESLWPAQRSAIVAARESGKSLLLSGPYFEGEDEEMGRIRAREFSRLLPGLEADDIVFSTRFAGNCEECKEEALHGLRYKWVTRNGDVIEYLEHAHVLYEYDSTEEISSPEVRAYFDQLAELLKVTGDRVALIGHTDNTGDPAFNSRLGMERAMEFRDHLISLGVDSQAIEVSSQGESEPMASNETEEGRRLNRRVEVRIIEQ